MSIEELIEKADKQFDYSSYKKAQGLYEKALSELPEPKTEQVEYLEIMAAIADTLILQNKSGEALKLLERIMQLPAADNIAYLHLRRGQIAFDTNRMKLAETELKRALELGGEEIFEEEFEEYYDLAVGNNKE